MSTPDLECFLNVPQDFLVCTTIHKARSLPAFNIDTFVKVTLKKQSKCTKVFQNSENPYYNEYFVFELSCSLAELLRLTVLYEVKKKTCCREQPTLGELLIDLHTVWNQQQRSFVKKWGKLETSIGTKVETNGYLQIDLAIVSSNQSAAPAIMGSADCDDIESNLLQNLNTLDSNLRFTISFYKGVFVKKSDYVLQVSFAGMNDKTAVRKGSTHPEWNEEIQFNWKYPSLVQTFLLQVMAHEHMQWKCVAKTEIYFDEISFNAVPSLGPTYIHLYDFNSYVGRILMEIKADKLNATRESISRTLMMKPTQPLMEQSWWANETFVVEFLMWQGEFIHANASKMNVVMKLGEYTSDTVECFLKNYNDISTSVKHFTQEPPFKAIRLKCFLPDNRLKYESDNSIYVLVEQMKSEVDSFKLFQLKYPRNGLIHGKCLKAIILSILQHVQELQSSTSLHYNGFKQQTVLDENRLSYLRDFFTLTCKTLKDLGQDLKSMRDDEFLINKVFQELYQLTRKVDAILHARIQDEWPELHLIMCLSEGGGKEFATCKLKARHFMYSQLTECNGNWCDVPRNFVFKDTSCRHTCRNCGCIRGLVYGSLGIATEAERNKLSASTNREHKERFYYQPNESSSNFICRLYIYQAKIQPGSDKTGLCDARLRVFFGQEMLETSTVSSSLSPVWNETVTFALRKMPGPSTWYENNPPLLALQVYDADTIKKNDYLGCGLVELSFQSIANRNEPLKSFLDASDAGSQNVDDISSNQRKFHSNSMVFNLKRFVKTRVAVQNLKGLKLLSPPPMKWVPIANVGAARVQILMSGELLEVNDGEWPETSKAVLVKGMPRDIQPVMARYMLEVTFIGLRNCQNLSSFSLGRYRIHVMMGEVILKSGISGTRLRNSINFLESFASAVVNLPEQFEYWPAIIATHVDYPGGGREVTLGATLVSNPSKYLSNKMAQCDFGESGESTVIHMGEVSDEDSTPLLPQRAILTKSIFSRIKELTANLLPQRSINLGESSTAWVDESEYNWWTKFYNSMYMQEINLKDSLKHKLVIYNSELEKVSDFSNLSDWAEALQLVHGIKIKKNRAPKEEVYGTLKIKFILAPCNCNNASSVTLNSVVSKMSSKLQSVGAMTQQTSVVVRVYLVQGLQFQSHDTHSPSDSYVKLQLGSETISDRANYVPNQSSPIFGKRFQMEAVIPREHILHISVYDRGAVYDDLIGSTFIDLEDRLRSKHRATVGVANEFNRVGYNVWRDAMTPYEILKDICKKYNLSPPLFRRNTVELEGIVIEDTTIISTEEDLQERLSLSVLKRIQEVPSIGFRIVPEHVETRSLYRNDRPGVEQGKLQLWVEIYDSENLPLPIDITPSPARMYELRIIVYNCSDVPLNEKNVFGTKMSDIYIKAWCDDSEASQSTDIHYRSLTGEGNFNWRMIFPIKYSKADDMMVIKKKSVLLEQYETKQPPIVYLQIWEKDALSADDFMGAMDICLSNFPQPYESKTSCSEKQLTNKRKSINLFREKVVKGWFPSRGHSENGEDVITGKLELQLEILSEDEAEMNPAGFGRNPPNALPAPDRPDTSFNPFTSPLKSLRHVLLPALKTCLSYSIIILIVVVLLMFLILDLPHELMKLFHDY